MPFNHSFELLNCNRENKEEEDEGKKFTETEEWGKFSKKFKFQLFMFIHTKKSIKLISLYVMSSTHFTENSDDFQQTWTEIRNDGSETLK